MSNQIIGKYPIDLNLLLDDDSIQILLPQESKVLSAGFSPVCNGDSTSEMLCIWAISETLSSPRELHHLVIALTGRTLANSCGRLNFIGTAVSSGSFVVHVFERVDANY